MEIHIHVHIHQEDIEMSDYRIPQQPYVQETPLLGAPVRPRTIMGQWGLESPDITAMTPPWMEKKPAGTKPVKVVPLCRPDWVAVPRQFARSA